MRKTSESGSFPGGAGGPNKNSPGFSKVQSQGKFSFEQPFLRFVRDNSFLDDDARPPFFVYLVLLNRPFHLDFFLFLYSKCSCFVVADGGANRLYDSFLNDDER